MFDTIRKYFSKAQAATATTLRGQAGTEIGVSGLHHQQGQIYEEALRQLRVTSQRWRLYREMRDNDGTIGSILFAVEMRMRRVAWSVEPASASPEDLEAAQFLDECRQDMSHSWSAFIEEVLAMLVYGFKPFEIVYKLRIGPDQRDSSRRSAYTDRRIGWRKFAPRDPETVERWLFDDDGGVNGLVQVDPNTQANISLPIERLLLFVTTHSKNNPEGRSVLRNAYLDWYAKKHIQEMEAIGIERDSTGYPVIRVPGSVYADSSLRVPWENIARNVRQDEQKGMLLPSDRDPETKEYLYDFALVKSPGAQIYDTGKIVARHDVAIANSVLAAWIFLGHEQRGTQALSVDQTSMFLEALQGWMRGIEDTLNSHAVPRLFAVNSWPLEKYPRLKAGNISAADVEKLSAVLRNLAQAGAAILPNRGLEDFILREAGAPERVEDEP